jgi:hypothetical protein
MYEEVNQLNRTPVTPRDMDVFETETMGIGTSSAVNIANGIGHLSCF